jgi:hypothetical protein
MGPSFIALLLGLAANAEACALWCNVYTCSLESCNDCKVCATLNAGDFCASWCNTFVCEHAGAICEGCSFCASDKCSATFKPLAYYTLLPSGSESITVSVAEANPSGSHVSAQGSDKDSALHEATLTVPLSSIAPVVMSRAEHPHGMYYSTENAEELLDGAVAGFAVYGEQFNVDSIVNKYASPTWGEMRLAAITIMLRDEASGTTRLYLAHLRNLAKASSSYVFSLQWRENSASYVISPYNQHGQFDKTNPHYHTMPKKDDGKTELGVFMPGKTLTSASFAIELFGFGYRRS